MTRGFQWSQGLIGLSKLRLYSLIVIINSHILRYEFKLRVCLQDIDTRLQHIWGVDNFYTAVKAIFLRTTPINYGIVKNHDVFALLDLSYEKPGQIGAVLWFKV